MADKMDLSHPTGSREDSSPMDARLEQPSKETVAALLEAAQIAHAPRTKRYSDVEEALRELKR